MHKNTLPDFKLKGKNIRIHCEILSCTNNDLRRLEKHHKASGDS